MNGEVSGGASEGVGTAGALREGRWAGRRLCFGRKGTGHVRSLHSSYPDLGVSYTSVPVSF